MEFYWRKEWTAPTVGVVSFAVGAGAGYLYSRKKHQQAIDDIAEVALKAMADLDAATQIIDQGTEEINRLQASADEAFAQLDEYRKETGETRVVPHSAELDMVAPLEEPPVADVDPWDQRAEEEERTEDAAYILHVDEFFAEQKDYRQIQLEWYEGDQILADEQKIPIYNPEQVVGHLNWGYGSKDPDLVYIRNDKLKAEYEIHRNPGHYQIEVMGLEAEEAAEETDLRHSRRIPRFRMD